MSRIVPIMPHRTFGGTAPRSYLPYIKGHPRPLFSLSTASAASETVAFLRSVEVVDWEHYPPKLRFYAFPILPGRNGTPSSPSRIWLPLTLHISFPGLFLPRTLFPRDFILVSPLSSPPGLSLPRTLSLSGTRTCLPTLFTFRTLPSRDSLSPGLRTCLPTLFASGTLPSMAPKRARIPVKDFVSPNKPGSSMLAPSTMIEEDLQ